MLPSLERIETLDQVPLGRSRLFAGVGAGLFAVAAALMTPARALSTPPYPCGGLDECGCCSGSTCCSSGCTAYTGACPGGGQCWITCGCIYNYQCCDWQTGPDSFCTCSGRLGQCGC